LPCPPQACHCVPPRRAWPACPAARPGKGEGQQRRGGAKGSVWHKLQKAKRCSRMLRSWESFNRDRRLFLFTRARTAGRMSGSRQACNASGTGSKPAVRTSSTTGSMENRVSMGSLPVSITCRGGT
jgi:hypothetical protein